MNYQQFIIAIKENLAFSLDNEIDIQIHSTLKNNGRERTGLTFIDRRINISPTIYLEEYYLQFENGNSMETIVENIISIYHDVKFKHSWQVESIKEFDAIQTKIVCKLIHAQKNTILLQTLPFVPYLDLAITFHILFDVDESGTATIPITNELLQLWNITIEQVYQIALLNSPKLLPATFKPMRLVIEELLGNPYNENILDDELMYVLTNELGNFGASCILYGDILDQIGGYLKENYYILPSSIHEVIIVPQSKSPDKEQLEEMVVEINETLVDIEDMLSDHVYYYNCDTKQLS